MRSVGRCFCAFGMIISLVVIACSVHLWNNQPANLSMIFLVACGPILMIVFGFLDHIFRDPCWWP